MRSVIIDGNTPYTFFSQILNSPILKELMKEFLNKYSYKFSLISNFEIDDLLNLFSQLAFNRIVDILEGATSQMKKEIVDFIEDFYSFWRSKHRFLIKKSKYVEDGIKRMAKELEVIKNNLDFKNLIMSIYRQILLNTADERLRVLRQLPSGAQASFLVDKIDFELDYFKMNKSLREINFVWSVVLEPPVVFHTQSNKRKGIFKLIEKPILHKIDLGDPNDWLAFPIFVGKKFEIVYVYKDLLAHGAGLANLFEFVDISMIKDLKPIGIYFFGLDEKNFPDTKLSNGVIYKENDGLFVGMVGRKKETDYFGYMKKMILTIHNLKIIEEGNLPFHGAMAQITLKNGKKKTLVMVGDSGAGKSETLEALRQLQDKVQNLEIIIDDMGSLQIDENENIVAFGTETGAFVRLDDLHPSYAYSTLDRSIFMNPHLTNARVIVPYSNYDRISKPIKIDYFFYTNNYDELNENDKCIRFFENIEEAYSVFAKGRRMAKGTTGEIGLTESYFANPFGAVQKKEEHEKIAIRFLKKMLETGVKIGEIKTQLGIPGKEISGPRRSALEIIEFLEKD